MIQTEQWEFLNSQPYYHIMRAKIVNQSSDFPVRRTGSYRHKKSTGCSASCLINKQYLTAPANKWHHTFTLCVTTSLSMFYRNFKGLQCKTEVTRAQLLLRWPCNVAQVKIFIF